MYIRIHTYYSIMIILHVLTHSFIIQSVGLYTKMEGYFYQTSVESEVGSYNFLICLCIYVKYIQETANSLPFSTLEMVRQCTHIDKTNIILPIILYNKMIN